MPRSTRLPAATHIPWRDAFELGYGIEYPSGHLAERVVQVTNEMDDLLGEPTIENSDFSLLDLSREEDQKSALRIDVSGGFSAYGVEADLQTDLRREMSSSRNTRSIILQHLIRWSDMDIGSDSVELTEAASKIVNDFDPGKWRDHFGDYYISGYGPEARFVALFRLTTESAKLRNSFSADLAVTVKKAGKSGELKTGMEWDKYTSEEGSDLTCKIYQVGVDPKVFTPIQEVSPDGVWNAYEQFVDNVKPIPGRARLTHCVALAPDLPRTSSIAPSVVQAIEGMYFDIIDARSDSENLPTAARDAMQRELEDLDRKVRGVPLTDADVALHDLEDCEAELDGIRQWPEYHELWTRIKDGEEPSTVTGSRKRPNQQWTYGVGSELWIFMKPKVRHVAYSKPGRIRRSVTLKCRKGYVLTRYKITSERSKNGTVTRDSGGLLDDHVSFSVKSQYNRGVNWLFEGWVAKDDKFRKFD